MGIFSRRGPFSGSPQQRRRGRIALLATVFVVAMLGMAAVSLTPSSGMPQARAASWNLTWSDDFNGAAGTGVNTANWKYDTGTGWGTGEIETMSSSTNNVYQDGNGHLVIKPLRDGSGNWTSGRIETQLSNFAAPVGGEVAFESSIQLPNVTGAAAQGYWPAFWSLGAPFRTGGTWPSVGEVDFMESINGTNMEYGTLHCGVDPGGPCNETTGRGGSTPCTPTTCQAAFHTYRTEIDRRSSPEQVRWYLDGVEFWHVNSNDPGMDPTTWANAIDHGFFIIYDVAMGGGWPGNPTASTQSGVPMVVDYTRVYTLSGGTPTPTPTATATPTSGCTSGVFAQGVVNSGSSSARPWFQPCGWTAGYVILHYIVPGQVQQNVQMSYNSSAGRWEYTVNGLNSGQTLQYSFTYQKAGLQYDTSWYTWTHP
ncbi:glycoside hydrolase family 16 protein [Dictyobacter aurantiacus]|uniref:Endo-1,3-beta-glucanase n=1 Tax=Dictyobacter aurantiacus TaxID=1936993 RepID=A0A401ZKI3_9CHLR|nr:glycoside hydrolase family 16 protein [Dictyobacter aurantiacus]GCE07324.1 endo-1,3-beta-glucanase [Dictyobacter aurantiacus]